MPSDDQKPVTELDRFGLIAKFKTKSEAIRQLAVAGLTTKQIADKLDVRYQHVRNVLKPSTQGESKVTRDAGTQRRSDESVEYSTPKKPSKFRMTTQDLKRLDPRYDDK